MGELRPEWGASGRHGAILDRMAPIPDLPPLPTLGTDPWFEERNAFDEAVREGIDFTREELEGRLSEAELKATIDEIVLTKAAGGVSPLAYGAVGDGVADDSAALQAAVDAGSQARPVVIDRTYRVTQTIEITKPGQVVVGAGGVVQAPDTIPIFRTLAKDTQFLGVRTKGGLISFLFGLADIYASDGPAKGTLADGGVVAYCTGDAPVNHVWSSFASRIRVIGCTATGVKRFGVTLWGGDANPWEGTYPGAGVYLSHGNTVTGCHYSGSLVEPLPFPVTAGIWGSCVRDTVFTGNTVSDFTDVGFDLEGSYQSVISGNVAVRVGGAAYGSFFGNRKVSILHNSGFQDGTTTAADALPRACMWITSHGAATDTLVIAGNTFEGGGVLTQDGLTHTGIVIADNTITDGGITLYNTAGTRLAGNRISGGMVELWGGTGHVVRDNDVTGKNVANTAAAIRFIARSATNLCDKSVMVNNIVRLGALSPSGADISIEGNGYGAQKCVLSRNLLSKDTWVQDAATDTSNVVEGNTILPA